MAMGASIALLGGSHLRVNAHKCFGRCGIGPNVAATTGDGTVLEFHHVDSVEKVCRIGEHLGVAVDAVAARCLELNLEANKALEEAKQPEVAVGLYSAALATGHVEQAGAVLFGRAAARLELARGHGDRALAKASNFRGAQGRRVRLTPEQARARFVVLLGSSLQANESPSPKAGPFQRLLRPRIRPLVASSEPTASPLAGLALRALADCRADDAELASVDFEGAMHEIELRRALTDALAAADRLPTYSRCWRVAAQALAASRHPQAAAFAQIADELDALPQEPSVPVFDDDDEAAQRPA